MDDILLRVGEAVALGCALAAVLALALGAVEVLWSCLAAGRRLRDTKVKKAIWVGFAGWILLALEFALAADIAETVVAPTWDDIAQLAAIAAIRTLLNFFLERDLEKAAGDSRSESG